MEDALEEIVERLKAKTAAGIPMTPFELGVLAWRPIMLLSDINKGDNAAIFRQLVREEKNPAGGYYIATINNQAFAIATKKPIFSEPNSLHGSHIVNWQLSLNRKLPLHDLSMSLGQMAMKIDYMEALKDACAATTAGTASMKQKRSDRACDKGTYIHDMLGPQIIPRACMVSKEYREFIAGGGKCEHVLPGRVWSPSFFTMACTPDGITCGSSDLFFECYSKLAVSDPYKPLSEDVLEKLASGGAPLFVHEIKTAQGERDGPRGTGTMVTRTDMASLYSLFLKNGADCEVVKKKAVSMIAGYLSGQGISPVDVKAAGLKDDDEEPAAEPMEKDGKNKRKAPKRKVVEQHDVVVADHKKARLGMFGRSVKIGLPGAYKKESLKKLSGDVVPYLCMHGTYKVTDEKDKEFGSLTTMNGPGKKKVVVEEAELYPAKHVMWQEGECWITFYDHTINPIGRRTKEMMAADEDSSTNQLFELFTLKFKETPFVLGINGDFKRQTMVQAAALRHMNVKLDHIFTEVLSYYAKNTSMPCCQISWKQNLHQNVLQDFVFHTAQQYARVDKPISEALRAYYYDAFAKTHDDKGYTFEELLNKKTEEEAEVDQGLLYD